jgi:hypothetical protein
VRKIKIPIYGGSILACANATEFITEYRSLARLWGYESTPPVLEPGEAGIVVSFPDEAWLQVLAYVPKKGGARAHEATHVAQAIARHVGMDPLAEEEAFAYLVQWCFDELG